MPLYPGLRCAASWAVMPRACGALILAISVPSTKTKLSSHADTKFVPGYKAAAGNTSREKQVLRLRRADAQQKRRKDKGADAPLKN